MMKKTMWAAACGLLLTATPMAAQTVYESASMMDKDLNGSARFVGMGGAMSALGGDLSVMGVNPAGIGIYRSNDAAVSFGMTAHSSENQTVNGKYTLDKTRGNLNSVGFVYSTKVGNNTPVRYLNIGFNYTRAKQFYRNYMFSGALGNHTQTIQMANQAGGIYENAWDNAFNNNEIGWLSAIGYYGAVIDPSGAGDQTYVGMYTDGLGEMKVTEHGGLDQYDLNLSMNLYDRVFLGLGVGLYDMNYKKYSYYVEDYTGDFLGEGYDLASWNRIVGAGVDLKLGAIVRPFEDSPFRVGVAVHTPTIYELDYKTNANLTSTVWNEAEQALYDYKVNTYDQVGEMVRSYRLDTPWLLNLSMGTTVGNVLALGAEWEYQDYSTSKFRDVDGYNALFDFENSTRDMLKAVHTLRLGAEIKPIDSFAIRAGYNYRTALFNDNAYKALPLYSIQTDTDCLNQQERHTLTFGVGYRSTHFYADIAYKYDTTSGDMYPFTYSDGGTLYPGTEMATKVTNSRSQALLTLGVRF